MARAMFDVGVLMKPNYLSIQETAELLVDFLLELGELIPEVLQPVYLTEDISQPVTISSLRREQAINELAQLTLQSAGTSMKSDTGIAMDSTGIKRQMGFRYLLKIFKAGHPAFCISASLGGYCQSIFLQWFDKSFIVDLDWYFRARQRMQQILTENGILASRVGISHIKATFPQQDLGLKFDLGVYNYFSYDWLPHKALDICNMTCREVEGGTELIFTREDFTESLETMLPVFDKLIDAAKDMIGKYPDFTSRREHIGVPPEEKRWNDAHPGYTIPGYQTIMNDKGRLEYHKIAE